MQSLLLKLSVFLLFCAPWVHAANLNELGIFAEPGEESQALILQAVLSEDRGTDVDSDVDRSTPEIIQAIQEQLNSGDSGSFGDPDDPKKKQPATVGRIVTTVAIEYLNTGYELKLGNVMGGGFAVGLSPFAVFSASAGLRLLPSSASLLGNQSTSEFTFGLRAVFLRDRIEVGMAAVSINKKFLTQEYATQFKNYGYDIRVSIFELRQTKFGDSRIKGPQGAKIFIAVSGFKSGSFLTPTDIDLGIRLNLAAKGKK